MSYNTFKIEINQMESLHIVSLSSFFLCLLLSTSTTKAAASDFIRASCNDTSYPSLCYTTLSPYAPSINNSTIALLAQTAISISLKKSKAAAAYVTRLNTSLPESKDIAPVLDDCVSTLRDAADLARDSMLQMKEIMEANAGANVGQSLKFKVSNVKTWMSAALSNQVTCIDGFEEVADGLVKAEVIKRAGVAKKVTSNALALVNKYVNA